MSATRFPVGEQNLRPPHERGTLRAFALAALFHLLLIALIAFGVHWKSHPPEAIEAELWSPQVQRAAPRPTAPLEHRQPKPQPAPEPAPAPRPQPAPTPQPQQPSQADIVLRQEREKAALEKKLAQEQQRLAQIKAEEAAKRKAEQQRLAEEKAQLQAEEKAKKLAEQKKLEAEREARLKEQQRLLAQQKKEAELKKREQQQQAQLAASSRADYMKQLMAQAGTGAANSAGTAAQTSGPSGAYAARIASLVRENVTYPEINQISGDPRVTVLVNLGPDGSVLTAKIERSSGVPSWDQAVLRAIERVNRFPPDSNGKIWTPMLVKAGPRDPG
ncbi:MAG: cell envelope integrity protein TolA [Thiomonas sp.]|jgi:colicin import membrane protein